MRQRRFAKHVLLALLIFAIVSGCTTYRYTRAFLLPDQIPETLPESSHTITSILPEKFESWLVKVRFTGVYNSNDARWISENRYTHIRMEFVLPEDTGITSEEDRVRHDTSANSILVDSVLLTLEPSQYDTVLCSYGSLQTPPRRMFIESLCLPEEVEAIRFAFTARLVDPNGTELARKEFSSRLVKWEDKWVDKSEPHVPGARLGRTKRPWNYP